MGIINFSLKITPDGLINLIIGLITFSISIWTIRVTKKQFKEEKRIGIKPYFNCEIEELDTSSSFKESIKETQTLQWNHYITLLNGKDKLNTYQFKLILNNIGLGHAIDCQVLGIRGNITKNSNRSIFLGAVQVNKDIQLWLNLQYCIKNKYEKLFDTYYNTFDEFKLVQEHVKKETLEKIYIDLKYIDVFGNIYIKTICIGFNVKLNYFIRCSLNPNKLTNGVKCNSVTKEITIIKEESIESHISNSKLKSIIRRYSKKRDLN